jgi:hypothetical protein
MHTNLLVGKSEGKRPLGRSRHRLKDNIKMNLRDTGLKGVDWIHLVQDRDQWLAPMNTIMNLHKWWEVLHKLSDY